MNVTGPVELPLRARVSAAPVVQIANLPYRRLLTDDPPARSTVSRITNPRHSRLPACVTAAAHH